MRNRSCRLALILWLALISLSGLTGMTAAQTDQPTQLTLENVPIQDEKLLVVNLTLTHLTDLYGAEVQVRYDPAQLKVRDDNRRLDGIQISPGPLIASDDRFVVTNAVDTEAGLISFAFTLLKPAPPISGDGALATVVFEITGNGPFSVAVDNVQLVSSELRSIPVTIQNLHLNGALEPVPEPVSPAFRLPWWQWGLMLGLVVILAGLGGLLFLSYRQQTLPQSPSTAPRKMPRGPQSTIRSARLLAEQGTHALEQGDLKRAYDLFSRAIELDPANVQAWLGKGLMAEQSTEKRICLQRVLALDPNNAAAKRELERLKATGYTG